MRYLILILPLLLLAGCATLSEDECRHGNWEGVGRVDGSNGREETFILKHAKACNKYGIAPNKTAWMKGRAQGLPLYCTPAKAFDEGHRGRELSPVCPSDKLAILKRENERGLELYWIEEEIAEIEDEIDGLNDLMFYLTPGDTDRLWLMSERQMLLLDLMLLRAERARYY